MLAAREAMANAAKHSGVDEVSVFVEADAERVEVFVRDRGAGFDPDAVPADRRGICESIVGRMERVGGTATHRLAPGEGTEVELELRERAAAPRRARRRPRALSRGVRSELGPSSRSSATRRRVEAVPLIMELEPDVVLLDVHMPGGGGHEVIAQVAPERPGVRFLALSVSDAPEDVIASSAPARAAT